MVPGRIDQEMKMTVRLNIAAAAQQLNRKLFDATPFQGNVVVGNDNIEVTVHGVWDGNKVSNYAGYPVAWRDLKAAA
jgi:hypothetical protein